jgi:hypothetical protein
MFKNKILLILSILLSLIVGFFIFAFLFLKTDIIKPVSVVFEGLGGVSLRIVSYQSVDSQANWLTDKSKVTTVSISDWKNDSKKFSFVLPGISLRGFSYNTNKYLIHGGEKFAAVRIPIGESWTTDRLYIIHRIPKALGQVTVEEVDVQGVVAGVAPDESGYFYFSNSKELIKADWQGNVLMRAEIPESLENNSDSVMFFKNGENLAVNLYNREENDQIIFIWDLINDEINLVSIKKFFPSYSGGTLITKDQGRGGLYITKQECSAEEVMIR